MTLEKHNMLYAVQYTLAEYDETGEVSRRTMEMLGARAILLRYEIEGEMAEVVAAKKAAEEKARQESNSNPDNVKWVNETEEPKPRKARKRKNCKTCGTRLTGLQRTYCSKKCSKKGWYSENKDRVKAYNIEYAERQKQEANA